MTVHFLSKSTGCYSENKTAPSICSFVIFYYTDGRLKQPVSLTPQGFLLLGSVIIKTVLCYFASVYCGKSCLTLETTKFLLLKYC
jgi:hypothetical protein